MDNAAQALLIAGGIVLALLTLSLLVVMFGNMNIIATAQEEEAAMRELRAWNAEWEAYNKRAMYGYDIMTVVNKAAENNKKYSEQPEYLVNIQVEGININTQLSFHKLSIFECTNISYSDVTGRVNGMSFKMTKE